jgi:hypothetical protein
MKIQLYTNFEYLLDSLLLMDLLRLCYWGQLMLVMNLMLGL